MSDLRLLPPDLQDIFARAERYFYDIQVRNMGRGAYEVSFEQSPREENRGLMSPDVFSGMLDDDGYDYDYVRELTRYTYLIYG